MKIDPSHCHIFNIEGDTIMALSSGGLYILDDIAAATVQCGAENPEEAGSILKNTFDSEAVKEAYLEIETLLKTPVRDHRCTPLKRELRALCLNITHKCNLACDYCFASEITGDNAQTMTLDVIKASLDFLFSKSEGVKKLQADFFGGEPLLAFDLVKEAVQYAKCLEKRFDKTIQFTLTTNGVLLNKEVVRFLYDNKINLIISLDGCREINDLHRKFKDGTGSYEKIIDNIMYAVKAMDPDSYYIRGTFTAQNMNLPETLKFYQNMGFKNVSLEPVTSTEDRNYAIKDEHLKELKEQYVKSAKWMINEDIRFFHFNLEMDNPLCLTRRITGCGAGVEYMGVDPLGDLYPCHQFIENSQFKMGNVFEGIHREDLVESFDKAVIYNKEGCISCWAKFYCGGGCHYKQYSQTGSFYKTSQTDCRLFRERMESALWYNAIKRKKGLSVKKS